MPSPSGHSPQPARIASYLRVSSEEQRERETIEIQNKFLDEYCRLYELEVAEVYADDGVSGTVPLHERPAGRRLLKDAKAGEFDARRGARLQARQARAQAAGHCGCPR